MDKLRLLSEHGSSLTAEWHPTRNCGLTPDCVSIGSNKIVWWLCDKGHEWPARIADRVRGSKCPVCSGKRVLAGYNDLATTRPDLAAEWHPTKNGDLSPEQITAGSNKKIWWQCAKGHKWETTPNLRVSTKAGCPVCSGRKVLAGYNDLATTRPDLAAEWHSTKNGELLPTMVVAASRRKVWWKCEKGHEWEAAVFSRKAGNGCPYCSGHRVLAGFNDLATTRPELAAEWHPTKNEGLTPTQISKCSSKKVWWLCPYGHAYQTMPARRTYGIGCPICAGRKPLDITASVSDEQQNAGEPKRYNYTVDGI